MNREPSQNQPIGRNGAASQIGRVISPAQQLIQDYANVWLFNIDASLLFADGWNISHQVVFNGVLVVTYVKP